LVFAAEVCGEFRRGGGGGLGEEVADEGDLVGEILGLAPQRGRLKWKIVLLEDSIFMRLKGLR
jgi:hypothetical protein